VDKEYTTGHELDILWAEFFATGKYAPVKQIVNSLILSKYKGTLKKIESGELKPVTKEIKRQVVLELTYQSAVWSLISNCKQAPLVFQYCAFMYENEPLDEEIKIQLGMILGIAQKEMKEDR
jgi:hypothetical protein